MPAATTLSQMIVVLADRDVDALEASDLRLLTDAASGRHVVLVAPAGPVAGERWIIDLTARRAHAQRRLDAWATLIAPHARSVASDIGDACSRLALSNARREFQPCLTVVLEPQTADAGPRVPLRARVLDRPRGRAPHALRTAA